MARCRYFGDRFADKKSQREAHELKPIGDNIRMVKHVQKFPLFGNSWPQFQEVLLAVIQLPDRRVIFEWFHQTTTIGTVGQFVRDMAPELFQEQNQGKSSNPRKFEVVLRHLDTGDVLDKNLELKSQKNTKKEYPYNGRYGEDKVFMRAERGTPVTSE